MSDEPKTAVLEEFTRLLDKLEAEAVEAERERCVRIFKRYVSAVGDAYGPASNPPRPSDCLAQLLEIDPEPPAPEPMTVEELIAEWWQSLGPLCLRGKVKAKLIELVRGQARRDAKMCTDLAYRRAANEWTSACHQCGTNICDTAGLQ